MCFNDLLRCFWRKGNTVNTPTPTQARALAHYLPMAAEAEAPRQFSTVWCSQCGAEFAGAMRDAGFSACKEHATPETHAALFARLFPAKPWSQPRRETDEDRAYDIVEGRKDDRDFLCERGL